MAEKRNVFRTRLGTSRLFNSIKRVCHSLFGNDKHAPRPFLDRRKVLAQRPARKIAERLDGRFKSVRPATPQRDGVPASGRRPRRGGGGVDGGSRHQPRPARPSTSPRTACRRSGSSPAPPQDSDRPCTAATAMDGCARERLARTAPSPLRDRYTDGLDGAPS